MASVASLREHLVEELNDLLSAEHQLVKALPKMQQNASRREMTGDMIQKSAEWFGSTVGAVKSLMPRSAAADRTRKSSGRSRSGAKGGRSAT